MKKILIATILMSIFLVSCTTPNAEKNTSSEYSGSVSTITDNNNIQTTENLITLTETDIEKIEKTLTDFSIATAHENSIYKIKMDEKDTNWLHVSAIKPISEIATHFNVFTSDEIVSSIRNSLVFDTAFSTLDNTFKGMKVYFYNNEDDYSNNDFYTLKSIQKEN